MVNIIIQLSKYIIIVLMAAYTFSCFSIFTRNYEDEEKRVLIRQDVLLFLLQIAAFGTMYLATEDMRILFLYMALAVVSLAIILLYNLIYPNVSRLVINNMCMLITVGMVMITRLSADNGSPYGTAIRQLIFVVLGITFGLIVPVLIRKLTFLDSWTYIYAAVGGAALLAVALFAPKSGGANLGFEIAGLNIQPSEFVKILFVFYTLTFRASLQQDFHDLVISSFRCVIERGMAKVIRNVHVDTTCGQQSHIFIISLTCGDNQCRTTVPIPGIGIHFSIDQGLAQMNVSGKDS